jgi:glycosyltransferase involved in cell wall biosynthesis
MILLAYVALTLSAIPAFLLAFNLLSYRTPTPSPSPTTRPRRTFPLSVLIPARNEADAIRPALQAILTHPDPQLEVLVLDDHSTDPTASIVASIAAHDARVRLVTAQPLPPGWCGKQHACWQLAQAARHDTLLFLDADVRLSPDAIPRLQSFLERHPHVALASGVPSQVTRSFLERLLIPLIHIVLLGYLPVAVARRCRWSAFAAGCGQLFLARRSAYFAADGHRAIRSTLHDGVKLPRAFRAAGQRTDIFDATHVASCRMYQSSGEVWRGLGKNATEGLAHPAAIGPWTFLLFGGHILPWLLLAATPWLPPAAVVPAMLAVALNLFTRIAAAFRFQQSWISALLHPLGIALLLLIQWLALFRRWRGQPMVWRGRKYDHTPPHAPTTSSSSSHPALP